MSEQEKLTEQQIEKASEALADLRYAHRQCREDFAKDAIERFFFNILELVCAPYLQSVQASAARVEVPFIFCELGRVLSYKCDPSHTLREHPYICKACVESRDEIQQLVADGDLNAMAAVVKTWILRLYEMHELMCGAVERLRRPTLTSAELREITVELETHGGVMEVIFGEVLSEQDLRDLDRRRNDGGGL